MGKTIVLDEDGDLILLIKVASEETTGEVSDQCAPLSIVKVCSSNIIILHDISDTARSNQGKQQNVLTVWQKQMTTIQRTQSKVWKNFDTWSLQSISLCLQLTFVLC
jgi:hypothetical protein